MPDPAMMQDGAGGAPGGAMPPPGGAPPPPGAAGPPPPQPGTGATPATMPIANKGIQAAAMAKLGNVVQLLHMISAAMGPGNEVSTKIDKAIMDLSKIVPPGSQSEGLLRADLAKMQAAQRTNQQNALAMRNQGGAGAPPPPPPPPGMAQAA